MTSQPSTNPPDESPDETSAAGPDGPAAADLTDEAVSRANARFYDALERADLDEMHRVWVHTDEAICAHPGRTPLLGWDSVWASWEAILGSGGNPQIILTEERIDRRGPIAWVTAIENMISGENTGAAAALNIFHHDGEDWRMVVHHAAPVLA
ncbi:MAG: nuclear transport factor 2 family protein [Actinomycetota bacterium]